MMRYAPRTKRHVVAAAIAAVAVVAPLTISSAATPEVGVAEMAAAQRPASRTGVVTRTVETTTTTTLPPAPPSSEQALEILALVNHERTSRGLQRLQLEVKLNNAAQKHTAEQAAIGDIYHFAADGTGPGDRITAAGYAFSSWGENVAAGQRSSEQVMDAWMASPGHCRNILNPSYTELGVGYLETSNSYRTWWTQKFARPRGVDAPAGTYNPAWC
ncbi:hypothetical protein YM304_41690 [Ilumatobacter coccineus YM16-304]|uniref:SCP domain-containing protein n=2 Tax=Ilumatobacter coccineus TaxID=467094 RepID=A0A6C7EDU3_ILUCY|nr:hypothetical protein YM304_41690 [Ilumatobacter coccineus YM16-304]